MLSVGLPTRLAYSAAEQSWHGSACEPLLAGKTKLSAGPVAVRVPACGDDLIASDLSFLVSPQVRSHGAQTPTGARLVPHAPKSRERSLPAGAACAAVLHFRGVYREVKPCRASSRRQRQRSAPVAKVKGVSRLGSAGHAIVGWAEDPSQVDSRRYASYPSSPLSSTVPWQSAVTCGSPSSMTPMTVSLAVPVDDVSDASGGGPATTQQPAAVSADPVTEGIIRVRPGDSLNMYESDNDDYGEDEEESACGEDMQPCELDDDVSDEDEFEDEEEV